MYNSIDKLARTSALLGGAVLTTLILLTCLSDFGRSLNSFLHGDWLQSSMPEIANLLLSTGIGPINGNFEIVEAGLAFVIFAFIPLCQLHGAHASVDVFTLTLSPRVNRVLQAVIDVIFALVLIVITVQLTRGMVSKMTRVETTLLLQFPVWWGYALSVIAAIIVAIYVAAIRILEAKTGAALLPDNAVSSLSDMLIGLLSFPVLLFFIFLRVPIGLAIFLAGLIVMVLVTGDTTIAVARLKFERMPLQNVLGWSTRGNAQLEHA